jgi:HK97 family phage portal protein
VRFVDPGEGSLPPILHLLQFHPLDDHYGFPPIEAAAVAADLHNAAGTWNKALLDNSARPSGALVYQAKDGGNLTSEQYERLKAELEEGFTGAKRAGRPLLLEGGLDWKAMALTPKDMDFIEAKNGAAREIALAFGVPPMLLGIPGDNTYANYQEANRAFFRVTVLPLLARLADALGNWLAPAFGGLGAELRLWFDADQVEALAADRAALWSRVAAADFLTLNEKRAAVGYEPVAGGDELR